MPVYCYVPLPSQSMRPVIYIYTLPSHRPLHAPVCPGRGPLSISEGRWFSLGQSDHGSCIARRLGPQMVEHIIRITT